MASSTLCALALGLAACGGGEPEETAASGETLSPEQAAEALDEMVQLRPGQYENSVEILDMTMPGMTQAQSAQMRQMMAGRDTASSFCLTPAEARQGPERMVQEMAAADCAFDTLEMTGGRYTARMQCTGADGVQGTYALDGTMTPDSSIMTMRIDRAIPMMPGAGRMQMEMRVTSRRTGECA